METTDTLATLFTKVTTADSDLSMAYDTSADKITLASSSGSVLVLGSSNDTSNFLVAARLNNNGTSSVTSSYKLGGISQASELSSANFNTTLVGNSGSFRVNGETVTWSSSDSVGAILASITQSGAGVVASYDGVNDRFLLSNNTTGDIGISLEDVQGNFLQATKLASEPINANGAQSASTSVSVNNSAGYAIGASSITVDATSAALSNGAKIYFENGGIFTLDADATLGATTLSGTLTGATLTNDETGYKSGTFNISSAVSLTSSAAATAKSVQINYSSGYANGATSLAVDSLGAALSNGDVIRFGNGATFTLSANAAQNAATLTGTLSGGAVADDEVGYLVQNITVGSNSNDFTTGDKVRFASGGILTLTADPASGATTLTGSLSADLSSGEATVSRSEAFLSGQVFQFANGSKLTLTAGVAASSTSLTGYWDSAVTNTEAGDQAQLSRGNDILYSLNGGDILTSHTNTITEESSGVSGLSVTGDVTGSGIRVDAVDTANNAITTTASHGLSTGDIVRLYTPATLMGGVSSKTAYYVRALSSSRISLHTSSADATAGSNTVDVTGAGTGDQYILGAAPPSFSVTVSADVGKVKEAVKDFVGQISKTQSLIGMHTTVKSDSDGKVEAGRLSNDRLVNEIAVSLRKKTMGEISGSGSSFDRLSDLGFTGNGYDNQISLTDENALDTILREKMGDLEKFFSTETVKVGVDGATADYQSEEGLAEMMEDYTSLLLGDVYGTEGALEDHRDNYAKEIDRISKNITDLERRVQFNKDQLTQSFIDMEMAQAKSNQEMQFLTQRFGG
ncbi:MAG: flagellar filament capping protein FliD [Verrucomicrobia bacterium]|nr:flagellar filament capping protein FliD [Verrucomicrobiota bacterium]